MSPQPSALIAEDEPLLAEALCAELAAAWPELRVLATVGDGVSAVAQALALRPDILFFDVRMPGLDGLDAAADIADQWPADQALPLLVFVTAYDQYAVQAFERQAVDYLLKPVQTPRLLQCLERIRPLALSRITPTATVNVANSNDASLQQLRQLLASGSSTTPRLNRIQASVGHAIHMVSIDDVLYFEAADKYVRVITSGKEYLIRTPIKDLLPQLDTQVFWQIHRSTLVRASAISQVLRDEAGRQSVCLHGSNDKLAVSRLYAHLFRAM